VEKAWKEIERLLQKGAVHKRKRIKLAKMKPGKILQHAGEELVELACEQDDIEEMADVLNCLVHFCVQKNWSMDDISEAMLRKLKKRIKE
jgi:phosphoribosyl-ATP pyrophosphohydrolase